MTTRNSLAKVRDTGKDEMLDSYLNDPVYIEESDDMKALKEYIYSNDEIKAQKPHLRLAFDLLTQVLFRMYKTTSYGFLVSRVTAHVKESEIFSTCMKDSAKEANWKKSTLRASFGALKKIMYQTAIDRNFVSKLTITESAIVNKSDISNMLINPYRKMDDSSPAKKLLISWVTTIRGTTKNKSPISVKYILYFIVNTCLPALGLSLDTWNTDTSVNPDYIKNKITSEYIRTNCTSNKQAKWLNIFLHNIMTIDTTGLIPKVGKSSNIQADITKGDGSDKHRIQIYELELIYSASTKSTRNELLYLLLITTGMRVGGLVSIKSEHVSTLNKDGFVINTSGRTIEKGNKWFSFILHERVRELIYIWLTKERPASSSPYLFPSRSGFVGHISSTSVRTIFTSMCKDSGLIGKHLHLHSLRHTYAHMLLESGNTVNIVSKLLGHSNTSTTESYYLKENAVEVAKRANIPWMTKSVDKEQIIPSFLSKKNDTSTSKNTSKNTSEKRRRDRQMNRISMFNKSLQTPLKEIVE
jgi:hypothetical protein